MEPSAAGGLLGDWGVRAPRRQKHKKGKALGLGSRPLRIRQPLPCSPSQDQPSGALLIPVSGYRVMFSPGWGSWSGEVAESPPCWWCFRFWLSSLLGLLLFTFQSPPVAALSILPTFYSHTQRVRRDGVCSLRLTQNHKEARRREF